VASHTPVGENHADRRDAAPTTESYDRGVARCLGPIVSALVVLALAGCGSGAANKAGATASTTVLRLADSDNSDQPSVIPVEHFAAEVRKQSGGSLRVQIVFQAAGKSTPRVESKTIDMVKAGRYDIGVVGARAWDLSGDQSFRAIQAPFLIDSENLLDRVLASPIASSMLRSLSEQGLTGLGLVPEYLRHPIGIRRPLASLADFRGARIRILPSRTSAAVIRALGATPVEISNDDIGTAMSLGRVDGEELALPTAPGNSILTANVRLYAKALTVFANRKVYDRLSSQQKAALRAAAADTRRYIAKHLLPERQILEHACAAGQHVVFATATDIRALKQAIAHVYPQLETDPSTKKFIEQIRVWKQTTAPDPPLRVLPAACTRRPSPPKPVTVPGTETRPSLVNGTYRWALTLSDAKSATPTQAGPGNTYPLIGTAVLQDGSWRFISADHDHGTYSIHGSRIRFDWVNANLVLTFEFTRRSDGSLHLEPVLPMDPGDQFVWSHKPWRRIGPPTPLHG
jgi:TRAP-type C4-dicarboxylate transport system substrate-binding protein